MHRLPEELSYLSARALAPSLSGNVGLQFLLKFASPLDGKDQVYRIHKSHVPTSPHISRKIYKRQVKGRSHDEGALH